MDFLISMRDEISRLYGKHDTLVRMILKFLMAIITFVMINLVLGQMAIVNHPLIVAGLSIICAFLPSNSMILIGSVMVLLHFYGISLEAAVAGGGMLAVLMLLYFSIAPMTAFPLLLGAIGAGLKIPGAVAILLGLVSGPISAIGVGFGVLTCYLLKMVSGIGGNLTASSTDAADAFMEKMLALISAVLENREMMLTAAICVLALWIVYGIRQIPIRFAWMIAAVAGLICYMGGMYAGQQLWGITINYILFGVETLAGLLIAWFAQSLLFNLDFKKAEDVQFEDDEYYYYLKAVPKRERKTRRSRRSERR